MAVLEPLLPPDTSLLTDPAHNYAGYRQHYLNAPGIPFLTPHLRDYQQQGETALQPLLAFLHCPPSTDG